MPTSGQRNPARVDPSALAAHNICARMALLGGAQAPGAALCQQHLGHHLHLALLPRQGVGRRGTSAGRQCTLWTLRLASALCASALCACQPWWLGAAAGGGEGKPAPLGQARCVRGQPPELHGERPARRLAGRQAGSSLLPRQGGNRRRRSVARRRQSTLGDLRSAGLLLLALATSAGHLLALPPDAPVQVHLQGVHLHDPHRRVVHVPHRYACSTAPAAHTRQRRCGCLPLGDSCACGRRRYGRNPADRGSTWTGGPLLRRGPGTRAAPLCLCVCPPDPQATLGSTAWTGAASSSASSSAGSCWATQRRCSSSPRARAARRGALLWGAVSWRCATMSGTQREAAADAPRQSGDERRRSTVLGHAASGEASSLLTTQPPRCAGPCLSPLGRRAHGCACCPQGHDWVQEGRLQRGRQGGRGRGAHHAARHG